MKPEVSKLGGQLLHQLLGLVQLREDGFTLHYRLQIEIASLNKGT